MSDEKKKYDDEKKRKPKPLTEGIDFLFCAKHGMKYPKGSKCPKCEAEKS